MTITLHAIAAGLLLISILFWIALGGLLERFDDPEKRQERRVAKVMAVLAAILSIRAFTLQVLA